MCDEVETAQELLADGEGCLPYLGCAYLLQYPFQDVGNLHFVCEGGLYVTFREGLENAFDGGCSFHTAKVVKRERKEKDKKKAPEWTPMKQMGAFFIRRRSFR